MRRLLLVAMLAATPVTPASANVGTCVVNRSGAGVCTGYCAPGDTITVTVLGGGGGAAHCGGVTASCVAFRGVCAGTDVAVTAGALTCEGGPTVICTASPLLVP